MSGWLYIDTVEHSRFRRVCDVGLSILNPSSPLMHCGMLCGHTCTTGDTTSTRLTVHSITHQYRGHMTL
eukprot:48370-Eustigmatos_ZCMA.PRE.1